ncbi:hypothetical protein HXT54_05895 [Gardnerella sp. KA00603]|uniref:Uncharacterized protein n=1 Tax=Gardnerella vaginalis 1500E TaxID=698957 RepID=I4M4R2_GARVA|nr:hypothetical protein [Gardnerella vaginalis]EIK84202.1 hypothetical protein CGSMWGv1500E_00675 [Gardnerella vaginalis 1500E]
MSAQKDSAKLQEAKSKLSASLSAMNTLSQFSRLRSQIDSVISGTNQSGKYREIIGNIEEVANAQRTVCNSIQSNIKETDMAIQRALEREREEEKARRQKERR